MQEEKQKDLHKKKKYDRLQTLNTKNKTYRRNKYMYEYVKGKSMYAKVSTPNTKFSPHKYEISVLTDEDTASKLEKIGLSQVRTRDGQLKYDEPAFKFSRKVDRHDGTTNPAPKLVDEDGNDLDINIGNGSEVTVKIKPYTGSYGTFAELIAVKVTNLVEYTEQDSDNEEF